MKLRPFRRRIFCVAALVTLGAWALLVLRRQTTAPNEGKATRPVVGASATGKPPQPPLWQTLATTSAPPDTASRDQADGTAEPPTAIARFSDWMERYFAAASEDHEALAHEGEQLARERREVLFDLIRDDPAAALAAAVPIAVRTRLPARVQSLLEERVRGRGSFKVLVADNFEAPRREVRREVVVHHRRYDAFVYGARRSQVTQARSPMHGIAIGRRLALHEDPVRRIEADEPAPLAAPGELCPVSQRPVEINHTPVAAEVGDEVERFCGVGHLALLRKRLTDEFRVAGGVGTAGASWTQGPKTCLFMRVAFPEDPTSPITEDAAYALMDTVNQWFVENSYGSTFIVPTVTPLLVLPQPKAWYSIQGTDALMSDARQAALQAGYDTESYQLDIVRHSNVPGGEFSFNGLAIVHGKGVWLQSSSAGVACHELGHNYGLYHANFWSAAGDSVIGPGSHLEYGNVADTMGAANAGSYQFNTAFKNQLDWLPDSFVQNVTAGGVFRLYAYDVPGLVSGQKYALKIRKDYDRNYWVEFRQRFTGNRWFLNGVLLNWDPWDNGVTNSSDGTHLLDTTPGTPADRDDAPVTIGRTFSDPAAGIHLTPVARGNDFGSWIDVSVNLGHFPSNAPPAFALTADRAMVPVSNTVHFSAFATDPEDDALAYAWDFGDDTFGPNSPHASKSWTTNGEFVVRCTVSDMKGGVSIQKTLIKVGEPGAFRVSGRVTTDTGVPLAGVRIHNGLNGAAYRGTQSDGDGYYVLPNLSASNNVSAVKYGFTLTRRGWTNPVVLGSNVEGLDWTGVAAPVVSVSASDDQASESGDPGVFRLSRIGPTNVALNFKLNRTGTAFLNADYTMSPAPSGSPLTVAIPAGFSEMDITVTPLSDTASEGPETVTLTLMADPAYVLGSFAEATVTIAADDAAGVPSVTVSHGGALGDDLAPESGADSGAFMFSRSSRVGGELTLYYAVSGTAMPGVDYEELAGVVTIPAGESATAVPFRVIDDADVESAETVVVTLLPDAAYNVAGAMASVTIVDDDPTTVTITATDATAREAPPNSGAFTVTRQGNLAANLLVQYTRTGTASNSADHATLSGSVTIPAGRATAAISVSPVNDSLLEGDETVVITLSNSPAYNIGHPATAFVTIIDDEVPSVNVLLAGATAIEVGTNVGGFTFTRSGDLAEPLPVRISVGGSAVPGADYVALGETFVIPAGTNSATIIITPLDDSLREPDERIILMLLPGEGYSIGTSSAQTVTLKDNDASFPGVGFTVAASRGPESDISVPLSVSLSTNSPAVVTVNYAVTGGSATGANADYSLANGILSFPAGVANQTINLRVINDSTVEPDETIVITLSHPTNAQLDAITSHTYTILDDDASGWITITASEPVASEGGPFPGAFRVSRSGGTTNAQIVNFQVLGSASAPGDYAPIGTSVVIPIGQSFVDIVVMPVDDGTDETNETVVLKLTSAPGGKILDPDTATVTILDNDDSSDLPLVTVVATDPVASEPSGDSALFIFRRDRATNSALAVQFTVGGSASSGSDFTAIGTSITIPAGAYETNLSLNVRDDASFETNETVVVTLTILGTYRVGAPASATATILDNENSVSVIAAGHAAEDGIGAGAFTLVRQGSTASNLLVNFVLAGTADANDFAAIDSPILIPAGTNAVQVPMVANNDLLAEGDETVVLTLVPGPGYAVASPSNATMVITDDEPAVRIVASDAVAYEGGGDSGLFTITRSGRTDAALPVFLTVSGTASNALDYVELPATVVIEPGQTTVELPLTPLQDTVREGAETIQLTLVADSSYAVQPPSSALVTLVDDEYNLLPNVSITSPATNVVHLASTNSLLVLEAVASDDGQPNPPGIFTFAWSRVQGPGTVTFGNSNAAGTTARFTSNGVYLLRLAGSDTELSAADELTVIVNAEASLTNGLQAHWKGDEVAGSTALDASGHGRHANLVNGSFFGPGRFGNGLVFDGSNDAANFPSMALTRLTVAAWIQADAQGLSTTPRIVHMPGFNVRVRRDTASTTNAIALVSERSTSPGEWRSPGNVVTDGGWFHVAVTYDSGSLANNPQFFVGGHLVTTSIRQAPAGTQTANTGTGYLGNADTFNRGWQGRLDDVRIYNRILTTGEITLAAAGPAANVAPVVEAGTNQTVAFGSLALLHGTISDDGLPAPGIITSLWTTVSGPGVVEFDDAGALDAAAVFPAVGSYVLRLTGSDGSVKTADDVTVTVTAPATVSIQAVDSTAAEFSEGGPPASGTFTLTRSGSAGGTLPVRLTISGTASNGIDFVSLTNLLLIPAGQLSASLAVEPIADTLAEGEESVTISIVPDPAYAIGMPFLDTVYIADRPWDAWRLEHFTPAELANPAFSGEIADPDLDQLQNLLEYAFDYNPKAVDGESGFHGALGPVPGAPAGTTGFVVTFTRRLPPSDLRYDVEVSTNLVTWLSGPAYTRETQRLDDGNGVTETVAVEVYTVPAGPPRFVRLKVTRL